MFPLAAAKAGSELFALTFRIILNTRAFGHAFIIISFVIATAYRFVFFGANAIWFGNFETVGYCGMITGAYKAYKCNCGEQYIFHTRKLITIK